MNPFSTVLEPTRQEARAFVLTLFEGSQGQLRLRIVTWTNAEGPDRIEAADLAVMVNRLPFPRIELLKAFQELPDDLWFAVQNLAYPRKVA